MSESCHPIAGNMVAGKWQLGRKIGSGAFGDVYEGQRLNTSDRVAIKLQHKRHKEEEWRVLKEVIGCEGLPQIYHMGWEKDYHAIVMQMLGDNLETLCEQCKRSFSTDTVAWIAIHCLRMLEASWSKPMSTRSAADCAAMLTAIVGVFAPRTARRSPQY